MAGAISTYISGIATSLTTSNTFLEGNQFDFNLDADDISTFPVVYFFNLLNETIQLTQSGVIRFQEFQLLVTFAELCDQDLSPTSYATHIDAMKELGNDFMVKIRQSDEWKNTDDIALPAYSFEPFIDRTDTNLIGVVLSTTIKLKLTGYDCTGL